ncbi:MAG TPA: alternative ribosome rescue aminoacyl-tRNA hydrolase ArfB [Cyclobacteriaceae bacterium]|nr:alternative ribosome rescue aminoacyl-tRNA hydrolase ArfB [Cyclobacteriaceae bacterium]
MRKPDYITLLPEIDFTTARSSGPGGQNVNKVNSKVILKLDVLNSRILSEEQKAVLQRKLSLTNDGVLIIQSQQDRSQHANKELALQKLDELFTKAFTEKKKRRATKASKASKERRLSEKKRRGEKKEWRRGQ